MHPNSTEYWWSESNQLSVEQVIDNLETLSQNNRSTDERWLILSICNGQNELCFETNQTQQNQSQTVCAVRNYVHILYIYYLVWLGFANDLQFEKTSVSLLETIELWYEYWEASVILYEKRLWFIIPTKIGTLKIANAKIESVKIALPKIEISNANIVKSVIIHQIVARNRNINPKIASFHHFFLCPFTI